MYEAVSVIRKSSNSIYSSSRCGFFMNWVLVLLMRSPILFPFTTLIYHHLCLIDTPGKDDNIIHNTTGIFQTKHPIPPNQVTSLSTEMYDS